MNFFSVHNNSSWPSLNLQIKSPVRLALSNCKLLLSGILRRGKGKHVIAYREILESYIVPGGREVRRKHNGTFMRERLDAEKFLDDGDSNTIDVPRLGEHSEIRRHFIHGTR